MLCFRVHFWARPTNFRLFFLLLIILLIDRYSFPALYSVTFTSSSFNCQLILTMMALHLIMLVAWESDFILLYFDSPFLLLTIAKTPNDTLMLFWNFLLMEEEGEMVKFGIIIIYGSSIKGSTRVHWWYETYTFLLFPLHNKNKNNNTWDKSTYESIAI